MIIIITIMIITTITIITIIIFKIQKRKDQKCRIHINHFIKLYFSSQSDVCPINTTRLQTQQTTDKMWK